MRKFLCLIIFLVGLMLLAAPGSAQQASSLASLASFTQEGHSFRDVRKCLDGDYRTYAPLLAGKTLEIDCGGLEMGYLQLRHYDRAVSYTVEVFDGASWHKLDEGGRFLSEGYELPEKTVRLRIHNTSRARLFLTELGLYSAGTRPEDVQIWHEGGACDLMLISCHPDDELLWFAGLLPTYAGERGLEVQTVTLVPSTPYRRLELLDALWHCGVTRYPSLLGFGDSVASTMNAQYRRWGRDSVERSIVGQLRRYRPRVVVTHDVHGEYGHAGHQVTADATINAVDMAASSAKYPPSAKEYGTWQVQKLYVHLWKEQQVLMDWSVPLARFDGLTGMQVAMDAFRFHDSQIRRGWVMEEGGPCDSRLFGLYMSRVGPDTGKKDFMEHLGYPEPESEDVELGEEETMDDTDHASYLVDDDADDELQLLLTPTDLTAQHASADPEKPVILQLTEDEIDTLPDV